MESSSVYCSVFTTRGQGWATEQQTQDDLHRAQRALQLSPPTVGGAAESTVCHRAVADPACSSPAP